MEEEKRIVSALNSEAFDTVDLSLRPKTLDEFVGQEKVKEQMRIYIEAAKQRNEPLDHVLLHGPPGLGKTCLSHIIANEMNVNIRITSGPAIERPGDLAAILTNLSDGDVLFIDEIHRLNASVEEVLYPAMEDFALDIIIGKGPSARSLRIDLPKFTLVGATTRAGSLTSPLRDRFGLLNRLLMYSVSEIKQIVLRSASILDVIIDDKGAEEISLRSRGTPRIANRLLRRVRDYAQIKGEGDIDLKAAKDGLDLLEVDRLGLDNMDRDLLLCVIEKFDGGPVGLDNLAASTGEESGTIEDVYEPYLLQLGFLRRTPKGRMATKLAYEHLGLKALMEEKQSGQIGFLDE